MSDPMQILSNFLLSNSNEGMVTCNKFTRKPELKKKSRHHLKSTFLELFFDHEQSCFILDHEQSCSIPCIIS